jgi:hypothetical protein
MRSTRMIVAAALAFALGACGSDSTGPSEQFESLAGTYAGLMTGVSQGIAMEATFSMTFTQSRGDLGGSYALQGVLTDGFDWIDVIGTGSLSGSITSGNNPSVNVTVTPGFCPARTAHFSGSYDSANRRLTLVGPIQIYNDACQVVLTYPTTVILTR